MTTCVQEMIHSRISVNHFQPHRPLADEMIASLVSQATRAPSAFNLQNWHFIAVQSADGKKRLKTAAFAQQKVEDASVAFIICGTLEAHTQLATTLRPGVEAGSIPQQTADSWVAMAGSAHSDNPQLQRDEAIRSASLAAMTLMLAAEAAGLGSCAMSGFDTAQVTEAFALPADLLPVMIVAVGYPAAGNWPQKPRKALAEVLSVV